MIDCKLWRKSLSRTKFNRQLPDAADRMTGTAGHRRLFIVTMTILLHAVVYTLPIVTQGQERYHITMGSVNFKSEAPLELIKAKTSKVLGILDINKMAFAISVPIATFRGFNSALQREHFNENYMESAKFPKIVYRGLILDKLDLHKNGFYEVMTKGKLNLHGIELVREIPCEIKVENGVVTVKSKFEVLLADHQIRIPSVVQQKLAEKIIVEVEADFVLKI